MFKLGSIPYIDPDVKASNEAGRHRPVYLISTGRGWRAKVEGISEGELPPADHDMHEAIRKAQRVITRRGGACLKRPKNTSMSKQKFTPPPRRRERDR